MEAEAQIITFQTYYDPMLAHLTRTRLEDNEIPCFIADEHMIGINPLYNNALGGLKLKIFARDLERCKAILEDTNSEGTTEETGAENNLHVNCPYCGSNDIKNLLAERRKKGFIGILISVFKSDNNQFHCNNCAKDFE